MKNKNILLSAYAFYPEFGGLEQQMLLLAKEWIKAGHSVTVLTEKSEALSKSFEMYEGIKIIRLPYSKNRSLINYISLIFHISKFIISQRNKYDFIHLRAALTLYPLVFGFWKASGVLKTTTVVTADTGGDRDEIIRVNDWPFSSLLKFFFNKHDYLNSICSVNYQHYLELGFPVTKLTTISNGVDTSLFLKTSYPKKVKNFIFLGRLIPEKGLLELVAAVSQVIEQFPDVQLHIAGDGILDANLKKMTSQFGLQKNIIFHGKLDGAEKESFFDLGECLVLPSYSEGLPLSVLEAAVRKKVLLTTDVSDLKKLFGSQIIICNKKDVADLAKKMLEILKKDFSNSLDYAAVVSKIDIKNIAIQYLDLYN